MLMRRAARSSACHPSTILLAHHRLGTSDPMEKPYRYQGKRRFMKPLRTPQFGVDILHDCLWSKGTAFNYQEVRALHFFIFPYFLNLLTCLCVQRDALGLRGLLPPAERTLEQQLSRVREHLAAEKDDLCKNVYLQVSLQLFVWTLAD
jgi:hypothetical protein